MRRQVEETKKTSPNVEETKTTVMLPSANRVSRRGEGERTPGARRGRHGGIAKNYAASRWRGKMASGRSTTATTIQDGENRSTEERISVPDSEGHEAKSRTVSKATEIGAEEKRATVETFSAQRPGLLTANFMWSSGQLPLSACPPAVSRSPNSKWSSPIRRSGFGAASDYGDCRYGATWRFRSTGNANRPGNRRQSWSGFVRQR